MDFKLVSLFLGDDVCVVLVFWDSLILLLLVTDVTLPVSSYFLGIGNSLVLILILMSFKNSNLCQFLMYIFLGDLQSKCH